MKSGLALAAAEALRALQDENIKLASDQESLRSAIDLTFQLYKAGSVSAENLESLYNDLCTKSKPELEILEKAAEYRIDSDIFNFGTIGEKPDGSGLDPLTRLLVEEW